MDIKLNKRIVEVMDSIYYCNYYIRLEDNYFETIIEGKGLRDIIGEKGDATQAFSIFVDKIVMSLSKNTMKIFTDLRTLETRIKNNKFITQEYLSCINGWCRARFIPIRENKYNKITHVLFAVEIIENDKKEEYKNKKLLEKTLDELKTHEQIIDALMSSLYLICHLDFKNNFYYFLTNTKNLQELAGNKGNKQENFNKIVEQFVTDEYKDEVKAFLNMEKICEKLKYVDNLSLEYKDIQMGWCRMEVHITKREKNSLPQAALLTSRIIEDEKQKEDELKTVRKKLEEELSIEKELKYKAEHDTLTGLLNRSGFESIIQLIKDEDIIGFILIDVDFFKTINDTYGHDVGDKILVKVANLIYRKFRSTDYVVRFGGDEFAVIIRNLNNMRGYFIYEKIRQLNEELEHDIDSLPKVTLSAGVSFSTNGFNTKLYNETDEALYYTKSHGRCGCTIFSQMKAKEEGHNTYNLFRKINNKSWYDNEDMYYEYGDFGRLIRNKQKSITNVIEKNTTVGVICGFCENNLPIYCISGIALKNLGYTYEQFNEKGQINFIEYIYKNDRQMFISGLRNGENEKKEIRLITSGGNVVWFSETHTIITSVDNRKMWVASFRRIQDRMFAQLCEKDYELVALIDCNTDEITIGRVNKFVKKYLDKKYYYSDIILYESKHHVREEDSEDYLNHLSLRNIQQKLENRDLYEYIAYEQIDNVSYSAMRYKYRYFNKDRNLILCSKENVGILAEVDDALGVYNFKGFEYNAEKIINQIHKNEDFVLLYFNICGFSSWNNALGYNEANNALKKVANYIKKSPISPIITGRLSADNFICLVKKSNLDYSLLKDMCFKKIVINQHVLYMRLKCGVYYISDKTINVRNMIDKAILASSYIKNYREKPYYIYKKKMNKEYIEKINVGNELPEAFEKKQFKVYYQPVFDAKTKKIKAAESLARWKHPKRGMISPAVFIPTMERIGNIWELDLYILRNVINLLKQWKKNKVNLIPISVNLSRLDLSNEKMITRIFLELEQNESLCKYIRFEITESAYVDIGDDSREVLKKIREKGCEIYIDDFGSGYSSMACISKENFDVIKMDMSLVKNIGTSKKCDAIVSATIDLTHKIEGEIIAEGVETKEQYDFLVKNGCDYIQGYYFSKPLREKDFEDLVFNGKN